MIKNYLKTACRNLKKNKGFSVINILGLAIGMAVAILIMLWVKSEMTYDRFYPKTDKLYIVGNKAIWSDKLEVWFTTPNIMAPAIKTEFPEVKSVTRVSSSDNFLFTVGEKKINAGAGVFADSTFMEMFTLPLVAGNGEKALHGPASIILTESFAQDLFETNDVVGKSIKVDSVDVFTVSAVVSDMANNTFLNKTKYILPWAYYEKIGRADNNWNNNSVTTYIEVEPNTDIENLKQNFKGLTKRHTESTQENLIKPISETWLYGKYENGQVVGGRIEMVRIFILIAAFILLIACINFMNISTAQSEKRAKEVGVRKVVGAKKLSLITQFFAESILMAFISGILAVLIVLVSLPAYCHLVNRSLSIEFDNIYLWSSLIGFILTTGFLAGSYPALFLSSFQPIRVLKGTSHQPSGKTGIRKILVITQFVIAVSLIVSTLVIRKQIKHAQDREVGYNKERLIYISDVGEISKKHNAIKQSLINNGIASSVTRTMSPLTKNYSSGNGFDWEGRPLDNTTLFNRATADDKIVATAGFNLVAGRDFDLQKFPTDSSACILNETAAKIMGFENPIGQVVKDMGRNWHIIGIIKDFVQQSPFDPINPLVIEGANGLWTSTTHIKFNSNLSTSEALARIEQVYKEFNPEYPFDYKFIDEEYALKFDESQKTGTLASLFAGLTIFISCLGLFGLAAFMAESRTKEIGVRKVLGASVFSVTKMLSKEFIVLVGTSCLIAFPFAYWAMSEYLSNYTYRISISWEIFAFTAVLAVAITIITVSYQSIRAALANPVDSLRDE